MRNRIILVFVFCFLSGMMLRGQDHGHTNTDTSHMEQNHNDHGTMEESVGDTVEHMSHTGVEAHGDSHGHDEFDVAATAIHHIGDANVFTILDAITIPLPMILYVPGEGWELFSSGRFHSGHHENGHSSYKKFVLHHGNVYRVVDGTFPNAEEVEIDDFKHTTEVKEGKQIDVIYAVAGGKEYRLDARSTLDGGVLGGGITSFFDFSPTKNIISMILVSLFLILVFRSAAKKYKSLPSKAPSGMQGLLETLVVFIRDDVAIPFIGKEKYGTFFPLLLSIFFFILGLNLFGQIPLLGSTNVTGNLTVTMILALIVFVIVNINGKRDYWQHIFWMPGVPAPIKPLLAAVEFMGMFIKPLTLMLRLAGNISAGHIAILSFIGLIFIFGNSGANFGGGVIGTAMAVPLTLFMMAIELVVAFVQAFVFTILTASYIGAAIEEHHHAEDHH